MGWGRVFDEEFARLGREIEGTWPPSLRMIHMRRLLDPENPAPMPSVARLAEWWGCERRTVQRTRKQALKLLSTSEGEESEGHVALRVANVSPPVESEASVEREESETHVATMSPPVSPLVSPPPTETERTENETGGDRRATRLNGSAVPKLFQEIPTVEEAIDDQINQALAVWGIEVNRQLGRGETTPATYTAARRWVRDAIRDNGLEAVLSSFRYLAHHPDNESLRRKAARGRAPFLRIRWWLNQGVQEHAHSNRQGTQGLTRSRVLHEAQHESGGAAIPE